MQFWTLLVCTALAAGRASPAELQVVEAPETANAAAVFASTHNINKIVDILLAVTREEVQARGLDSVSLPDFVEEFKKKVGFVKVKGKFEGYNGWAKSLTSLVRRGDAVVTASGLNVKIDVPLGFNELKAGYRYHAHLSKIKVSGHVDATVGSNAMRLQASLSISDSSCSAAVDSLQLTDLGKIKVKATGLGPLNFILNKVATRVAKHAHDKIENAVQDGLRKAIDKAGLKFSCDQL